MKISITISLIACVVMLISCNSKNDSISSYNIPINKNWSFRAIGDSSWLPATIPGSIHTDLINNGIIDDPYYRLNERNVQWIDKKDWEYRTEFSISNEVLEQDVVKYFI